MFTIIYQLVLNLVQVRIVICLKQVSFPLYNVLYTHKVVERLALSKQNCIIVLPELMILSELV